MKKSCEFINSSATFTRLLYSFRVIILTWKPKKVEQIFEMYRTDWEFNLPIWQKGMLVLVISTPQNKTGWLNHLADGWNPFQIEIKKLKKFSKEKFGKAIIQWTFWCTIWNFCSRAGMLISNILHKQAMTIENYSNQVSQTSKIMKFLRKIQRRSWMFLFSLNCAEQSSSVFNLILLSHFNIHLDLQRGRNFLFVINSSENCRTCLLDKYRYWNKCELQGCAVHLPSSFKGGRFSAPGNWNPTKVFQSYKLASKDLKIFFRLRI